MKKRGVKHKRQMRFDKKYKIEFLENIGYTIKESVIVDIQTGYRDEEPEKVHIPVTIAYKGYSPTSVDEENTLDYIFEIEIKNKLLN